METALGINIQHVLDVLGVKENNMGVSTGQNNFGSGPTITSTTPVDGSTIASLSTATEADYRKVIETANEAYGYWRNVPAPKRGEIVRQYGEALRVKKAELGALVSYEMGKSYQEGLGEVQEMIDICDFAVGLSRQLYGLTMHS